ncbi:hypothetical protein VYU27_001720 [Nannochloropsis oceanica]
MPATTAYASSEPSSLLSIVDRTAYDRLIKSIADDLPQATQQKFREEAKECTDYARARKLIELVLAQSAVIMARPVEKDIEGSYQVLISLLDRLSDPADLPVMVERLVSNLRSSANEKPGLRLKLLSNFYNLLKSGTPERFQVLLAIIEYARDTKQLEVLSDFFANLEDWKKNWRHLSEKNERQLYLLVSDTLASAGKNSEAHHFLIKYISTFSEQDTDLDLSETAALAVKGVIGAVKQPLTALSSSLLGLPAVKRLAADPAHKTVHELLQVFSFGKLADFLEYESKYPGVLAAQGVDREKALRDMRLLSVSLLAAEYEEIPYSAVSATLQIPHDEVESWVVQAITAKLLEAKMDQQQEVVMVTRASHRHFSRRDWSRLQEKLHLWRQNVSSLLDSLRDKRVPAPTHQALHHHHRGSSHSN